MGLFRRRHPDSLPAPLSERPEHGPTEAELAIVEYTASRTCEELTEEFQHVDEKRQREYQRTVLERADDPEVAARAVSVIQEKGFDISHRELEWQIAFVRSLTVPEDGCAYGSYVHLWNEDKGRIWFTGGIREAAGRSIVEQAVADQRSLEEVTEIAERLPIDWDAVRRDLMPLIALREAVGPADLLSFTADMDVERRDAARRTATKLFTSKRADATIDDTVLLLEGIGDSEVRAEAGISAAKHLALRPHISAEALLGFIRSLDGEETQDTALRKAAARLYDAQQVGEVHELIELHPTEEQVPLREALTGAIYSEFSTDGEYSAAKYSTEEIRESLTPRTELVELLDRRTARV